MENNSFGSDLVIKIKWKVNIYGIRSEGVEKAFY